MPKLQAAVPAGAPPNALLRVRLPDGNEVNVRVPDGLRPGDEFIFEVSSMGEIAGGSGGSGGGGQASSGSGGAGSGNKSSSGGGGKKGEKFSRQASTNKKKNRRGQQNSHSDRDHQQSFTGGGGRGSQNRDYGGVGDHSSHGQDPNGGGGFITGFLNLYNQVYDILSQNNNTAQPKEQFNRQPSAGGGISRPGNISRQGSSGTRAYQKNPSPATSPNPQRPMLSAQQHQQQLSAQRLRTYPIAPPSFLDRELSSGKDFLAALAVGVFVGSSIVMGFLGGVLYVTPIDAKGSA